jgi:hypothetical protein
MNVCRVALTHQEGGQAWVSHEGIDGGIEIRLEERLRLKELAERLIVCHGGKVTGAKPRRRDARSGRRVMLTCDPAAEVGRSG